MSKNWRFKTEKEFENEFGENWRDEVKYEWPVHMDQALGLRIPAYFHEKIESGKGFRTDLAGLGISEPKVSRAFNFGPEMCTCKSLDRNVLWTSFADKAPAEAGLIWVVNPLTKDVRMAVFLGSQSYMINTATLLDPELYRFYQPCNAPTYE